MDTVFSQRPNGAPTCALEGVARARCGVQGACDHAAAPVPRAPCPQAGDAEGGVGDREPPRLPHAHHRAQRLHSAPSGTLDPRRFAEGLAPLEQDVADEQSANAARIQVCCTRLERRYARINIV